MGACASAMTPEEKEQLQMSTNIDRNLHQAKSQDTKIIKLLLLGTGESGKSTIFKQMQILYTDEGFSAYEQTTYKHVVRRNVVESMQTLLIGAARFGFKLSSPEAEAAANFILTLDPLAADFWHGDIVGYIQTLWPDEAAVHQAYVNRAKLQLPDSAKYLFEHIHRIGKQDFTPTRDDILRARLRTSGIVEKQFKIRNVLFRFLDVGGQRNERRKWIHCFENVTAVIFVAAISEYDQVLYEDEKENRLHESISVFDNICNNVYFMKTAMILFLNKKDIFQEKIKTVPLTVCFPEYVGDSSYEDASEYIKAKFFQAPQKVSADIFAHFTCATDTNNVERVFDAVRKVILKRNLEKLGLA